MWFKKKEQKKNETDRFYTESLNAGPFVEGNEDPRIKKYNELLSDILEIFPKLSVVSIKKNNEDAQIFHWQLTREKRYDKTLEFRAYEIHQAAELIRKIRERTNEMHFEKDSAKILKELRGETDG